MILKLTNPATGETFRELPRHSWEEVKVRLKTAGQLHKEWKDSSINSRIQLVRSAMDYFKENVDIISRDITLQMGKPISQSLNEVEGAIYRMNGLIEISEKVYQMTRRINLMQ